jgi:DNA-binding response OmpR family regulator
MSQQWKIELGQRELRAHGIPVPIGNRAFQIISVLVQSADKLVSKDGLMVGFGARLSRRTRPPRSSSPYNTKS